MTRLSSRDHFRTRVQRRRLQPIEFSTGPRGTGFARLLFPRYGDIPADHRVPKVRKQDHYQNARIDQGRAPKTVNGELSVLRQVLRHARLWYRIHDDYHPLRNTKPPVGQALTDEQQQTLFEIARSEPRWMFAYVAAVLAFYSGLRACEIKGLQNSRRLARPQSQ
jgi:integrase